MAKCRRAPVKARPQKQAAHKRSVKRPRKGKTVSAVPASGKGKPRAPSPCRYVCTDELLAASRWRYENTTDSVPDIAADMGCHTTTLQKKANRLNWVRYRPPPHDL